MKITIGRFDADTGTKPATFEHNGVTHRRQVNAVLRSDGKPDPKATRARVEEVAAGVAAKIEMGVIGNAVPAAAPQPEPEAPEAGE